MSLFVIREVKSGMFCTSAKHRSFSSDLNDASQFVSRANANKSVRSFFGDRDTSKTWTLEAQWFYAGDLQAYIESLINGKQSPELIKLYGNYVERYPELEVVEVALTLV